MYEDGRSYWSDSQVRHIIRDERYTGVLVSLKYKRPAVGSKKQIKQPESEWIRIPGAHEAIVTAEQFALANSKIRRNKKNSVRAVDPNRSPLSGKIFCGHCGLAMRWQNTIRPAHYCSSVKLNKGRGCFDGKVYYDDLSEAVLVAIQTEARKAYNARKSRSQAARSASSDKDAIFEERKRVTAHIGFLERRSVSLYEDFADGKLGKNDYLAAKAACADELSGAEARIAELTVMLDSFAEKAEPSGDEPLLWRILNSDELTDELLSLVERIIVYDPSRVEVRFAFADSNIA
jgi:hypothetical protein